MLYNDANNLIKTKKGTEVKKNQTNMPTESI